MSKTRRRRTSRGKPITEAALSKNSFAKDAFDELTARRGVDKDKLLSLLAQIAYAAETKVSLVDGIEDQQVRYLPRRIRGWADTIERVNESAWVGPNRWRKHSALSESSEIYPEPLNQIATPELREATASRLESLPRSLRFYAAFLEAMLWFFRPTGRRRQELRYQPVRLRKWLTMELLVLVRKNARAPRHSEVATLLNRAYEIAGEARNPITEEDLRKLEKNNRWYRFLLYDDSSSRPEAPIEPREES